ncbi:hypothetical protein BJI67_16265 (plasmid) [Acidihalobacter aeolianus]|uniref:Uncharacterized protein n=1 Tax=Acidihalobacter aeolianus TaxID=2792603 RepID=A0A1D8KCX7_9GAMM|nr:hypothetical protein [Acidihalobacter aeolianus]AOV18792.1 hypothetical protein BJI67_16265 [Acidihalobacter aeolianus]
MPNVYDAPFYVPPRVASKPPFDLKDGDIILFKDDNWGSEQLKLNIYSASFPEGQDFSFAGTPLQDAATWIAFKLPDGVVCTLTDNILSSRQNPYNFAGAGICVDLIGTGKVDTVDLPAYGANDCLSAGIWRQVDLAEGWIQLFRDVNQEGPLNTIFAAEWPTGPQNESPKDPGLGWNNLSGWFLDGKISSINYPCLTPPQLSVLATEHDGSGSHVSFGATNTFESHEKPATANFTDNGFNDRIHAFKWTLYQPVKANIKSASMPYTVGLPSNQVIEESITGDNGKSTPIGVQLSIAEGQTYTISSSVQLQYSMTMGVTISVTETAGVPGVDSTSGTVTTSFSTTFGETTSKTHTASKSFNLGQTINLSIPGNTQNYKATARVGFADLPLQELTVTGQFYYKQKLPGAVEDKASGLWRLDSPVVINAEGGIGTQLAINVGEVS